MIINTYKYIDTLDTPSFSWSNHFQQRRDALNLVQLLSFGAMGSEEVVDRQLAITNTFQKAHLGHDRNPKYWMLDGYRMDTLILSIIVYIYI